MASNQVNKKDNHRKKKAFFRYLRRNGFSLIELSVVIIIISVITGSALSVLSQASNAKFNQTMAKIEIIEQAFAAFIAINNRLPCPADAALPSNNSNFGIEYCTGNLSYDLNPSLWPISPDYNGSYTEIIGGTIPTRALFIPDEYMYDGWGNRFTYVVTKGLSGGSASYGAPAITFPLYTTNMGLIKIKDASGSLRTDRAATLIISHGENGHGAWPRSGGSSRINNSSDADEIENSHIGGTWDEVFVQKEPLRTTSSSYDDVLSYKMRWQLVKDSGNVLSNVNCSLATTTIQDSASFYCGTSPGDINCSAYFTQLANQINNLCIQ